MLDWDVSRVITVLALIGFRRITETSHLPAEVCSALKLAVEIGLEIGLEVEFGVEIEIELGVELGSEPEIV